MGNKNRLAQLCKTVFSFVVYTRSPIEKVTGLNLSHSLSCPDVSVISEFPEGLPVFHLFFQSQAVKEFLLQADTHARFQNFRLPVVV